MRGKRKKRATENSLLTAMRFVSIAQRSVGAAEQTHCRLFNNFASGSNGIISAGHKIQEDIQVCPHTMTLTAALENLSNSQFALTLIENERLAVRAEKFEAIVHYLNNNELPVVGPDAASYLMDERFVNALDIAGQLVADGATKVINSTIQLKNCSVLSSNGSVIIQAWHGVGMPEHLIAPKALATAVGKVSSKSLYRFGFSDSSLTLHYDDGAWLKTQLYPASTELPDLLKYLDIAGATPVTIPEGFFELVKRLEPFSEDGQVLFSGGEARTTTHSLSTYAVESVKHLRGLSMSFSIKSLLTIQPYVNKVHFNAAQGVALFFGDNVRAAVSTKVG
jgi:hypothetical protein